MQRLFSLNFVLLFLIFWLKIISVFILFKYKALPHCYNPFTPGLEVKYALEEATKLDSKLVFLGYEFDEFTWSNFYHENRYTLYKTLYKILNKRSMQYDVEMSELQSQIHSYGLKKFIESSCDQYTINWVIQILDRIFPDIKRVIIEKKEEQLFTKIMENKGKVINYFYIGHGSCC